MELYKPYLYTEDGKFLSETMSNAVIEAERDLGNRDEVIAIPTGEKQPNKYGEQARFLDGVRASLNVLVPSATGLGTFLDGERFALVEPLVPFERDHGRDIRSPWLSREKLLSAGQLLLVRILLSLEQDRSMWIEGATGDASKFFAPDLSNQIN